MKHQTDWSSIEAAQELFASCGKRSVGLKYAIEAGIEGLVEMFGAAVPAVEVERVFEDILLQENYAGEFVAYEDRIEVRDGVEHLIRCVKAHGSTRDAVYKTLASIGIKPNQVEISYKHAR